MFGQQYNIKENHVKGDQLYVISKRQLHLGLCELLPLIENIKKLYEHDCINISLLLSPGVTNRTI